MDGIPTMNIVWVYFTNNKNVTVCRYDGLQSQQEEKGKQGSGIGSQKDIEPRDSC